MVRPRLFRSGLPSTGAVRDLDLGRRKSNREKLVHRLNWRNFRTREEPWMDTSYSLGIQAKLTPAAGTLTRGRSLISGSETEVETPRLSAVCSITKNQYLKKQWAKLNAHTDASGNLCDCSRITSWNVWHEISGACYECRCRSCSPMLMYRTQRWFLGLENFLIKAFHR